MPDRYPKLSANANWNSAIWYSDPGLTNVASVPTSADDVKVVAASFPSTGLVLTVTAHAPCKSLNFTGVANNPTLSINSSIFLQLYGSLTLVGVTIAGTGTIGFYGSDQNCLLTTNGITMTLIELTQAFTGKLTLQDNLVCSGSYRQNSGEFNTGADRSVTCTTFTVLWTGSKILALNNSTINCTSYSYATAGLTITGTSTIRVSGTGAFTSTASLSGAYHNIELNGTSHTVTGNIQCSTMTRNGTATSTDTVIFIGSVTCTTAFVMRGNSVTNRLSMTASVFGVPYIVSTPSWAGSQHIDIHDCTAVNPVDLSTITGLSGDGGGNSGITFTPATTQVWDGQTANWNTTARWTSRVPLPQDDVVLAGFGNTITINVPRAGRNITVVNSPNITATFSYAVYGSLNLTNALSYTQNTALTFTGRGNHIFNPAGRTFDSTNPLFIRCPGGSLTLAGNLSITNAASSLSIVSGTFNDGGFALTAPMIDLSGVGNAAGVIARRLVLSGTTTLTRATAGAVLNSTIANVSVEHTGTITLTNTTANNLTWIATGAPLGFNTVVVGGTGAYTLTFSGNNRFNTLTVDRSTANKALTFTDSTTTFIRTWSCPASGTNTLTITGTGTAGFILRANGIPIFFEDYITVSYAWCYKAGMWYRGTGANTVINNNTRGITLGAVVVPESERGDSGSDLIVPVIMGV